MLDILLLAPSDVEVFDKMDVEKIDTDAFPLGIAYIDIQTEVFLSNISECCHTKV